MYLSKGMTMKYIMMVSVCLATFALAEGGSGWSYEGATGPEFWGTLEENYSFCSTGSNQSPVNISNTVESALPLISFDYHADGVEAWNNGHTLQVNYQEGSSINVAGHDYELKQFHFHTPSENAFNGQLYPMEMHLVHANSEGALAVIGIMFEEGEANGALDAFIGALPAEANQTVALQNNVNARTLLPTYRSYYRFTGSLTTPPCSEGVLWMVMKYPVSISPEQLAHFQEIMHFNSRPLQPLNARAVMR